LPKVTGVSARDRQVVELDGNASPTVEQVSELRQITSAAPSEDQ